MDSDGLEPKVEERAWSFNQWFRSSDGNDVTAMAFNNTGDLFATGDGIGNVVILANDTTEAAEKNTTSHYKFFGQFQSHDNERDYVQGKMISPRINSLKWGPNMNGANYLLTTNDREIKLWKVVEDEPISVVCPPRRNPENLEVPSVVRLPLSTSAILKKLYYRAPHISPINRLSFSATKDSFLSGDCLKINLWDLYRTDCCLTVVDMAPDDPSTLTEVMTALDYHPSLPSVFFHGSNLGKIRLCDLRTRALADKPKRCFDTLRKRAAAPANDDPSSLFDEVTSGVCGAKFSHGGRFIISRDYMSVKIWDINYEKRPLETIYVQEHLRPHLFSIYETGHIWDLFGLGVGQQGDIVTGAYNNNFHVLEMGSRSNVTIQASKPPVSTISLDSCNRRQKTSYEPQPVPVSEQKKAQNFSFFNLLPSAKKKQNIKENVLEPVQRQAPLTEESLSRQILVTCWHPEVDAIAVASQENLFFYNK